MKIFQLVCLATFLMVLLGCGGGIKKFPIEKASGVVLCEGMPVSEAEVYFEPLQEGKSAVVGKQAFSFTDADGRFVLSTYGNQDGAVVGRHRVRVGGNPNSCECVLNSEIDVTQIEIKEGEKNDFEIVLKKKTGKERPAIGYDADDEDDD